MDNRREFLKRSATTAAGIFFVGCEAADRAHPPTEEATTHGGGLAVVIGGQPITTVDIHCHCYIQSALELVKDEPQAERFAGLLQDPQGQPLNIANLTDRLEEMDGQGIDIQALSLSTSHLYPWANRDLAVETHRIQNEALAELCSAQPDRFAAFASVAMQYPDLAVQQLDYAVKNLGLRGCMIATEVNGEELSDPQFHPFWAKAEELDVLVFIHPVGFAEGQKRFQGNGNLRNVIGNPLATTVALSHLIFEGTLDQFPGLKICAAHGGGFLASYIGRSDHCVEHSPESCEPLKKLPSEYLKQLYFDSLVYTSEGLRHVIAEVGSSQVLLGTDYPYAMGNRHGVNHVLNTPGLDDEEKRSILGGNAARLLKLEI